LNRRTDESFATGKARQQDRSTTDADLDRSFLAWWQERGLWLIAGFGSAKGKLVLSAGILIWMALCLNGFALRLAAR
jgi:hypothetical protein